VFPKLSVQPLPDAFERLGLDMVSRTADGPFEHSPLACNGWAKKTRVNRYCLVDDETTAFQLAAKFEAGEGEPGKYYVVEVWRNRRPNPAIT
jgi:hypothetical protein